MWCEEGMSDRPGTGGKGNWQGSFLQVLQVSSLVRQEIIVRIQA
jgi:hypothetical protein